MSIHPEDKSCSDLSRVLVLDDTPARSVRVACEDDLHRRYGRWDFIGKARDQTISPCIKLSWPVVNLSWSGIERPLRVVSCKRGCIFR